ncbi:MAG TPA: hypothetical protein VEB20_01505 [Azospirillaceae bacterium]|nr:hypothetical protein [Azospirillaceae bacterium]HYE48237.1 hypothetical protein [Azospirillaceae bacterium]
MPTEIRHIIFTNDEVMRAVVEYHKRTANPLPPGNVIRCAPEKVDQQIKLSLHVALDADGARQILVLEEPVLAAALIFYCIQNKIPLPTKAAKSLQMVGEQVALKVTKENTKKPTR